MPFPFFDLPPHVQIDVLKQEWVANERQILAWEFSVLATRHNLDPSEILSHVESELRWKLTENEGKNRAGVDVRGWPQLYYVDSVYVVSDRMNKNRLAVCFGDSAVSIYNQEFEEGKRIFHILELTK